MPNTAKQEAVRKAYGDYWEQLRDHVDEDGYSSMDNSNFYPNVDWNPNKHHLWRPKSLQGIENNNGWIRIESEEYLPKDRHALLWVYTDHGNVYNYFFYSTWFSISELEKVVAYQPIVKPENPIY